MKILVVEDQIANRELLRELIESFGYEVFEAANGQEGLDRMRQCHPDLMLLDIQMPVLDGFATLKQIRSDPDFRAQPVYAFTAFAMDGDELSVMSAGFDAYLTKPIDFKRLEKMLAEFSHRRASVEAPGVPNGVSQPFLLS